jgi:hypothetical protein
MVQFVRPGRDVLEFKTNRVKEQKFLIAAAKVRKMLTKGFVKATWITY